MAEQVQKPSKYLRFDRSQRIEHAVLVLSFTILGITGLPQMYPDSWIGNGLIRAVGGIEMIRIIHRASAVILIILSIYHVSAVIYKIYVRRIGLSMLPSWKDVTDAGHLLAYNLGRAPEGPAMPRYTFAEKMEYWAVVWGTVVMIITGFMLWNPIATTRFFPGQFIPVSKAAHGGEALLAVLAIVTWHLYHVHIKHFNRSIFTGYMEREVMEEEHALELAQIEAGEIAPPPPPDLVRQRRRVFVPLVAIASVVLLLGLAWFVTFEQTAITTVPRESVEVFVPADSPAENAP